MANTINADNGVASGNAGLKYASDGTGILALQTNGTTAVTVDASQNVGIGVTSPADTAVYGGKVLDIKGPTYVRDTSGGGNYFSSGVVSGATYLQANGTANFLAICTNQAERMRIDIGGNVLIGTSSLSTPPTGYISAANTFAFKNRLINGGLQVWQRSTSVAGVTAYTSADRWYMSGSGTMTSARSATLDSPSGNYSLVLTSGATSSYINPTQAIEAANVYSLRGKVVTFSFYCKLTAGTWGGGALQPLLYYSNSTDAINTGTGLQSAIAGTGVSATPNASWQLVRGTYLIPADAVGLSFMMNTSLAQASGVAWAFSDMQVELGYAVTSFDQRPQGMELMLCQRYYQKSYDQGTVPGTATRTGAVYLGTYSNTATGTNNGVSYRFPVLMRGGPGVVFYDPDVANTTATGRWDAATVAATAGAMSGSSTESGLFALTIATTGRTAGAGLTFIFHFTASAEL